MATKAGYIWLGLQQIFFFDKKMPMGAYFYRLLAQQECE